MSIHISYQMLFLIPIRGVPKKSKVEKMDSKHDEDVDDGFIALNSEPGPIAGSPSKASGLSLNLNLSVGRLEEETKDNSEEGRMTRQLETPVLVS